MANTMTWNQDQQCYEADYRDQDTGYLTRLEVDGDVIAEAMKRARGEGLTVEQAEYETLSVMAWLDCADGERVRLERVRPLTDEEMRTPRDFFQPSNPQWASGND